MEREFSVAEARAKFPLLLDEVESGHQVRVTRRGKPVAVMLSEERFRKLTEARPNIMGLLEEYYSKFGVSDADRNDDPFARVREKSAGRKVDL